MTTLDAEGLAHISHNARPTDGTRGADAIAWLDARIAALVDRIKATDAWRFLTDPASDRDAVRRVMMEIYQEIAWYQPDVIQATVAAIGFMPRSLDPRLFKAMLAHQADEFDHGEMAVRDYVNLGGDERRCRTSRPSPASFAVAACWQQIEHRRDPFMYLGALYLFEGLTPLVTGLIKPHLRTGGIPDSALEYIEFHSTEDIKHANLVNHMIAEVVDKYPEAVEALKHGYECFEHVYPLPVWTGAFHRALHRPA